MTKHYSKSPRFQWTKEDIKSLISLWDSRSLDELSKELRASREQVQYMAHQVRLINPQVLSKKYRGRVTRGLIEESLKELGK